MNNMNQLLRTGQAWVSSKIETYQPLLIDLSAITLVGVIKGCISIGRFLIEQKGVSFDTQSDSTWIELQNAIDQVKFSAGYGGLLDPPLGYNPTETSRIIFERVKNNSSYPTEYTEHDDAKLEKMVGEIENNLDILIGK